MAILVFRILSILSYDVILALGFTILAALFYIYCSLFTVPWGRESCSGSQYNNRGRIIDLYIDSAT